MISREHSMMNIAPTVSAILGLPRPAQAKGTAIQEIVTDLSGSRGVAILATDALGMFAWNLWKSNMPHLESLHTRNSVVLQSVMPSITPVNFATMVTGANLAGHAVHSRSADFACQTLFDVIRQAGMKSTGIGLDGYTGCVLLGRFADICGNAGDGSDDSVAARVIEISEGSRPEFLIAQLGRVDDTFHKYGPSSHSVVPMLRETDVRLKTLVEHLKPMGYGVIILSDHGQHDVTGPSMGKLKGSHGTDRPEDCLVPCTWT